MYKMQFTIDKKSCDNADAAVQNMTNAVMEVAALGGTVTLDCGGIGLSLTVKQANDLMFSLKKAQWEAKAQKRGGERWS